MPLARSTTWSVAWTARPTAVPARPRRRSGRPVPSSSAPPWSSPSAAPPPGPRQSPAPAAATRPAIPVAEIVLGSASSRSARRSIHAAALVLSGHRLGEPRPVGRCRRRPGRPGRPGRVERHPRRIDRHETGRQAARRSFGPMDADDQVVPGPGGGDIEQANLLAVVEIGLAGGERGVARSGQPTAGGQLRAVRSEEHPRSRRPGPGRAGAGDDDDRELQPLRRMDRHDPDGVEVRLRKDGFGNPGVVDRLAVDPGQEPAQVAARSVGEQPRLVDDEPEPSPRLPPAGPIERQQQQSPVLDHPLDEDADVAPPSRLVVRPQRPEPDDHRVVRRQIAGRVRPEVPAAAGGPETDEVIVTAAVAGRPERAHHGQLVGRVVDGMEDGQQVLHLRRGIDQRARLEAVRDTGLVERLLQGRYRPPGGHENGDVGQRRRATGGSDRPFLGPGGQDRRRDVGGFRRSGLVGPGGRRDVGAEDQDRRPGARMRRPDRVGRDMAWSGGTGRQSLEHCVDPRHDPGNRAEIGGQRQRLIGHRRLGRGKRRQIGPAEPVDRLPRVAHEEQPPRFDRERLPRAVGGQGPRRVGGN